MSRRANDEPWASILLADCVHATIAERRKLDRPLTQDELLALVQKVSAGMSEEVAEIEEEIHRADAG